MTAVVMPDQIFCRQKEVSLYSDTSYVGKGADMLENTFFVSLLHSLTKKTQRVFWRKKIRVFPSRNKNLHKWAHEAE